MQGTGGGEATRGEPLGGETHGGGATRGEARGGEAHGYITVAKIHKYSIQYIIQ
jgi:hypothetical protein